MLYRLLRSGLLCLAGGLAFFIFLSGSSSIPVVQGQVFRGGSYQIEQRITLDPLSAQSGGPKDLAVDETTNRVYIIYQDSSLIAVLDGATDTITAYIDAGRPVGKMVLHPERQQLYVTHFAENAVSVIDLTQQKVIQVIDNLQSPEGIAVNTQTQELFVQAQFQIQVIDGLTWKMTRSFDLPAKERSIFAINSKNNHLYWILPGGEVDTDQFEPAVLYVIDAATGSTLLTHRLGNGNYWRKIEADSLVLDPTNDLLFIQNAHLGYLFWSAVITVVKTTDYSSWKYLSGEGTLCFGYNPNTGHLFANNWLVDDSCQGANVMVNSLDTGENVASIPTGLGFPYGVGVNTRTNRVYVITGYWRLLIIDDITLTAVKSLPLKLFVSDVAINPAMNQVYVSIFANKTIVILDGTSQKQIGEIQLDRHPEEIRFSAEKNRLYVETFQGSSCNWYPWLTVIDVPTHRVLSSYPVQTYLTNLRFHPTRPWIYQPTESGLKVTDEITRSQIALIPASLYAMEFQPTLNLLIGLSYVEENRPKLVVIESDTNTIQSEISLPERFRPAFFRMNPATGKVYIGGENQKLDYSRTIAGCVVDLTTRQVELFTELVVDRAVDLVAWEMNPATNQIIAFCHARFSHQKDRLYLIDATTQKIEWMTAFKEFSFPYQVKMLLDPAKNRVFLSTTAGVYVIHLKKQKIQAEVPLQEITSLDFNPLTQTLYAAQFDNIAVIRKR